MKDRILGHERFDLHGGTCLSVEGVERTGGRRWMGRTGYEHAPALRIGELS